MEDFERVLARNAQKIGAIIVSRGNNDLAASVVVNAAQPVAGSDVKITILPGNRFNPLILAHIELVVLGDFAVVLQGFEAVGLGVGGAERNIADFQQLRRGEEDHVGRIVKNRVDQASLVNADDLKAGLLRLNCARQTGRSRADYDYVRAHVRARFQLRLGQRIW